MQNKLQKLEEFNNLYLEKSNNQVLLVKFSASWCLPCRKLQLEIDKLLKEKSNLLFLEVDVEKFFPLIQKFEIQAVPTLLLFYKEKEIKREQGYMKFPLLEKFIKI